MFTGLIETTGTLTAVGRRGANLVFTVRPDPPMDEIEVGESIALDGACQTVIEIKNDTFSVEVSPETAAVTTAAQRKVGQHTNLERALRLGDRLGGHLVAGHVDAVGTIRKIQDLGEFIVLGIQAPPSVMKYCVPKGSLAVDGISLTINKVDAGGLELGLIPYTWQSTTLHRRRVGDKVNLEADMIGKYIERFVIARFGAESDSSANLTEEFLAGHGFMK